MKFVKLDIHHQSAPIHLEGFLADGFQFQCIKLGGSFTAHTHGGAVLIGSACAPVLGADFASSTVHTHGGAVFIGSACAPALGADFAV
ncbi:hypothetical protein AVEN_27958-1, partial [Araneus ventricosus]